MSTIQTMRAKLMQRRRALLQRYREELERVEEELAARDVETVERATEEWDATVLSRLGDTDLRAIVAVTEAIARVDAGTYGRCTSCDQPIARARLEARPEAATCIACASAAEQPYARTA
jgi:DnaK suppressor protein